MRGTHSALAKSELEGVHVKPVDGLPRFPRTIDPPARPFMRVPIPSSRTQQKAKRTKTTLRRCARRIKILFASSSKDQRFLHLPYAVVCMREGHLDGRFKKTKFKIYFFFLKRSVDG
jgi:hypothetical protein